MAAWLLNIGNCLEQQALRISVTTELEGSAGLRFALSIF